MSRELGDVAQLLQVPQDAGEVAGAAHDHTVGLGHGQAGHSLRVAVQRLWGGERAEVCSRVQNACWNFSRTEQDLKKRTCRSFIQVALSLVATTSHTQTTELDPAVMRVVGLGEAAHSVSPQSHRLSHTAQA